MIFENVFIAYVKERWTNTLSNCEMKFTKTRCGLPGTKRKSVYKFSSNVAITSRAAIFLKCPSTSFQYVYWGEIDFNRDSTNEEANPREQFTLLQFLVICQNVCIFAYNNRWHW